MPVPNDLSPEEEAEFSQHGVPPAGQGREPLSEAPPEKQAAEQLEEQHEPAEQAGQARQTFHRQDGKFASREEVQRGEAKPSQQEPGQEQPVEGEQEPPVEGEQEQPTMVPHAALHQARLRAEQAARRAQLAETRLNAILANQQNRGEQREEMPDINTDPAGYLIALERRVAQFEEERVETQRTQQIDSSILEDEASFSMTTPDYQEASDYYVQSRAKELLSFYPPEQAQKLMLKEARQIAQESWKRGRSMANTVYDLAQARGYNPNSSSSRREPGFGEESRSKATEVVESVARAKQASRSLSGGAGGGSNAADLNAQALLSMSEEEFANWLGEGDAATKRFATIGS
jgi:hypothetical protein